MVSSTKRWYMVAGILAVLVAVVVMNRQDGIPGPVASSTPTPKAMATSTPKTGTQQPTGGQGTPVPAPADYGNAVKVYSSSRIQFDAGCQASPKSITVKNGAGVMLDNRSGDGRYIKVGSVVHYLDGYGWKIIAPTSATLPATLAIGCGSAVNVGTIVLQK